VSGTNRYFQLKKKLLWRTTTTKKEWKAFTASASGLASAERTSLM
jgi:hypothetical protein